jgi:hypothetical protein
MSEAPPPDAADALRRAGYAAFHRERPKCPLCGWDTRLTDEAEFCDICHLAIIRDEAPHD